MSSSYQEFHYNCKEINKHSPHLDRGLSICAFYRDINRQIKELSNDGFSYDDELNKLKDKYIVFYHEAKDTSAKHKFIIQITKLYCGGNGHCGAIRMNYNIIKDEYVLSNSYQILNDELKKSVDDCLPMDGDADGRHLFHYTTTYFSPRYYQGTKICNSLKEAESYYNEICRDTHYCNNKLVLHY